MATTTYKRAREQRDRAVWIALGLALAPVIALGFSRFAYALLLPPMRGALGWSFTQAGGMNTANAIGYVIGAATGAWWTKHFSIRTTFIASLIISSLALLVTGATTSYAVLMALRFVGGVATAVAFVVGSSLAARIRHHLLPVYFAGAGIGIVLSGIVVPVALAATGAVGWRIGWLVSAWPRWSRSCRHGSPRGLFPNTSRGTPQGSPAQRSASWQPPSPPISCSARGM
jgi:predicted MFS family arabinose efflux permease